MVRIMFLMYGNYNYNIKKLEIIGSGGGTKMSLCSSGKGCN